MIKAKHGADKTHLSSGWLICISAALVFAWMLLKIALARFPIPPNTLILYPLYAAMTSPNWRWVIVGGLFISVVILHRVAFLGGLYRRVIVPSLLVQGAAIFFTLWVFSLSPFLTLHLQTLTFNQRIYHLVLTQDRGYFEAIRRYDVMECDATGLMCQHYATPYQREGNCFPIFASLEIDPTVQRLVLNQDHQLYWIDPDNPMGWSPCPLRGLTR